MPPRKREKSAKELFEDAIQAALDQFAVSGYPNWKLEAADVMESEADRLREEDDAESDGDT